LRAVVQSLEAVFGAPAHAVATSEASLHITFGVRHMVVQDFLNSLLPDLSGDPFFHSHLSAYDDDTGRQRAGVAVASRLRQVLGDPNVLDGTARFPTRQGLRAGERLSVSEPRTGTRAD
jgi:hypothetical protein